MPWRYKTKNWFLSSSTALLIRLAHFSCSGTMKGFLFSYANSSVHLCLGKQDVTKAVCNVLLDACLRGLAVTCAQGMDVLRMEM